MQLPAVHPILEARDAAGGAAEAPTPRPAVVAVDLVKTYGRGEAAVTALGGVSASFTAGRFSAIMGPSGSGKSTLLHCLAGLDTVDSGKVLIGDTDITRLKDKQLTRLRRSAIGFVSQSFNLLPTLTAAENIELPLRIAGRRLDRDWLDGIVCTLGLGDRLRHRPSELSAGSSNGSPSPAPWSPTPSWCSPTSRPATSTRAPARSCSACCGTASPSWAKRS